MLTDTGHTPLSTAVFLHSYEAIRTLVAAGADLTFTRTCYLGSTKLEDLTLIEILVCDWHDLSASHKTKSRCFALKTLDTLIELGAPTAVRDCIPIPLEFTPLIALRREALTEVAQRTRGEPINPAPARPFM